MKLTIPRNSKCRKFSKLVFGYNIGKIQESDERDRHKRKFP
jgi:hypothetical protein